MLYLSLIVVSTQLCATSDTRFNIDSLNPTLHHLYMSNMLQPSRVKEKSNEIVSAIRSLEGLDYIRVADIGAGSGAVYSALKEEIERDDTFPLIHLISVEAADKEAAYLRENCPSIDGRLTHEVVLENGIFPHPERACDILILNSVVHEIISYGAPQRERYDRQNFWAFMQAWENKVSENGFLFFRDFVKPDDSWMNSQVTICPKSSVAQDYLPELVSDLMNRYKEMNPLRIVEKGSCIQGPWESIMEILASFQWGSEGFRQSVIDEQFIHFSVKEMTEIASEHGFDLAANPSSYTSTPYFQKWIDSFDIAVAPNDANGMDAQKITSVKQMPSLKASMLFRKISKNSEADNR